MQAQSKILIAHQGAELYGSDRMLLQFLSALKQTQSGFITLHLPGDGPLVKQATPLCDHLIIEPISILRISLLKTKHWLNLKQFWKNIKTAHSHIKNHDIIVVNTCVVLSYLFLFPFMRKRKYIYIHEIPAGLIKLAFNIMLLLSGAQLICNSQATAKAYPLVPLSRKHVIYNAVDTIQTMIKESDFDTINALMVGRLSHRKGHHIVLSALSLLPLELQQRIHLRIVGSAFNEKDDYLHHLKELLKTLFIKAYIDFIPFCENPADHYTWCDFLLMPSIKPESFGLVALEAMQYQKPVIASHIGALPEIIIQGQTGILVQAENPKDLTKAIATYLNQPDLIKTHGIAAQSHAAQNFSIENYNKRIIEVIHG
jgi:glycosyltransferase involved in cell wall biosynthesis